MNLSIDVLIKKAGILIEALPYIQKLSGKTVVIKYGGNAMLDDDIKSTIMEDITLLKYVGINPIIVHGGGPDINRALDIYGIKSEFKNGLRVTDKQTMDIVQMTLVGRTNKEIVSMINQKGAKAIGLCGLDGNLLECEKYTAEDGSDIGYVGKIVKVNSDLLDKLAGDEYIPVVAPIGAGADGHSYNINADTVAGEIASALCAEKLMLLTDVEGVKMHKDDEKIIPALTIERVHELIAQGVINKGMIPKVMGCVNALLNGVGRTHIIDGRLPHCILLEIFTYRGIGTMITKDPVLYHQKEELNF
jgi:acetylglutamate kinase